MEYFAFFSTVCNLLMSFILFGSVIIKLPCHQKKILTAGLSLEHLTIAAWLFYLFDSADFLLLSGLFLSIIGCLIFLIVSSWFYIKYPKQ